MKSIWAISALAVLVAACSQDGDKSQATDPVFTASQPAGGAAIPAAFHGAWDWTGGNCLEYSDLRMEIGPQRIQFYESLGTVEAVRSDGDSLTVELAMEGEGEKWEQTTELALVEGGALLETVHEDPSGQGKMRLKRCAGETTKP